MATRHQRRKAAKAKALTIARQEQVKSNLMAPRPDNSAERLFRMMAARPTDKTGGSVYDKGLHRNNAVGRRPHGPDYVNRQGMGSHRKPNGQMHWNLDHYVDNLSLRTMKK